MAANGAVALRMLGARDYDLIISDSGMPEVSGRELYREIERREPRFSRRFVFVTGDILNPRTRAFPGRDRSSAAGEAVHGRERQAGRPARAAPAAKDRNAA